MKPYLKRGFWFGVVRTPLLAAYVVVALPSLSVNKWLLYGLMAAALAPYAVSVSQLFLLTSQVKRRARATVPKPLP